MSLLLQNGADPTAQDKQKEYLCFLSVFLFLFLFEELEFVSLIVLFFSKKKESCLVWFLSWKTKVFLFFFFCSAEKFLSKSAENRFLEIFQKLFLLYFFTTKKRYPLHIAIHLGLKKAVELFLNPPSITFPNKEISPQPNPYKEKVT